LNLSALEDYTSHWHLKNGGKTLFALRKLLGFEDPLVYIPINLRDESVHLDFGCGTQPRNPFRAKSLVTVDIFRATEEIPTHLIRAGEAFPFNDSTFTSLSAYDVVEHLSRDSERGNDFVFYMREIFRVLKPGGVAVIVFPAFPHRDAFSDPTHINFITSNTVDYFVGNKFGPFYAGIDTNFQLQINRPLRNWSKWLPKEESPRGSTRESFRRKLSLAKRDFLRFTVPQHRIWVLSKEV